MPCHATRSTNATVPLMVSFARVGSTVVVSLRDVTVSYGSLVVLDSVSTTVVSGEVVAVRGVNGSGKTTLLRVLVNASKPKSGERIGPSRCAYVPAALTPPGIAARTWLRAMKRPNRQDSMQCLDRLGFNAGMRSSCSSLSFGNLRKLILAEALSSGERLIVIDELSAGLDDRGLDGLSELVAELSQDGTAMVLADQHNNEIFHACRTITTSGGALHESTEVHSQTVLILGGPIKNTSEFLAASKEHGFYPLVRQSFGDSTHD